MKRTPVSRVLSCILAVVILITSAPGMVAQGATTSDGMFDYTVLGDGTIEITECNKSMKEIIIPSEIDGKKVTSIGSLAFVYCFDVVSITIPDSVINIENIELKSCSKLAQIIVGRNNLKYSSDEYGVLFDKDKTKLIRYPINCSKTDYIIPGSVTSIGDSAFNDCDGITSITIPDSVTSIGNSAFNDCDGITSIIVPDSVTSIGESAFSNCNSMTSISLSSSVTTIENGVFAHCGITSITIPDSVTSIGDSAFMGCMSMTSIVIPDSVISIENNAFRECTQISTIVIPNSVTSIGDNVFEDCTNLKSITLSDNITRIGNQLFFQCLELTAVIIPDGVTEIGWSAFAYCNSLKAVSIPESVTSIGRSAFFCCTGLLSVSIPDSITNIEVGLFSGCTSLSSITLPDGITNIGWAAFERCTSLTSVTIPDGVTTIENSVFMGCENLTSVALPDGITSIGNSVFMGCENLTSVALPSSITSIGNNAFAGCTSLKSVTLPNGITTMGSSVFMGCENLTSVTLPDSITKIGGNAFQKCTSLKTVTIPNGVTAIEGGVFSECENLTSVTLPDSITSIGGWAFQGCSSLKSITIPNGVTTMGDSVFMGCENLTSVILPDGIRSIERSAFSGCSNLMYIIVPNSVRQMRQNAFYDCQSLKVVFYKGTEEQWENINFQDTVFSGTVDIVFQTGEGDWPITPIWGQVKVKETATFGDSLSSIITMPASGTATDGDVTVSGTFSYEDAVLSKVGTQTVTVSFTVTTPGEYYGVVYQKEYEVEVSPYTLTAENVVYVQGEDFYNDIPDQVYTGEGLEPTVAIQKDSTCYLADVFDVSYADNVNAGTATVTVQGRDIFTGTVSKTFKIKKADITGYTALPENKEILASDKNNNSSDLQAAAALPETMTVSFAGGTAEVPVKWNGPSEPYQAKGGTYTFKGVVPESENLNAYSVPVTVTLTVNPVHGTASDIPATTTVTEGAASEASDYTDFGLPGTISIICDNDVDTQEITPVWDVSLDVLKKKTVGSKTTVTCQNIPIWLTMEPISIVVEITDKFPVTVTVTQENGTYGSVLGDPSAKQEALDHGTDERADFSYLYTGTTASGQKYSSSEKPTQAGSYTVTATLVSDTHAGTGSADFKISPKALEEGMVEDIPSVVYNKEAHEPVVVIADGETALVKDTDYTVSYSNNINVGTATAAVIGKWNYTGEIAKAFTIQPAPIGEIQPVISGTAQVGSVLTASLDTVADGEVEWQWKRGDADVGTGKTYLLAADDSNKMITVVATAKEDGNYIGTTLASEAVAVEKMAISGTVKIAETNGSGMEGTVDTGDILTADTSNVIPAVATLTYQWYRNDVMIEDAAAANYVVTDDDANTVLKVVVSVSAESDYTGSITASIEVSKAVLVGTPVISGDTEGSALVGTELTVEPGVTGATEADYNIIWLRDGEPITDADEITYIVAEEDQGKIISVMISAKKDSNYTGAVVSAGIIIPAAAPGKPVVTLTEGNGMLVVSWNSPMDNGAPILSYTLTITDGGNAESIKLSPDSTSYTFTGLTNGKTYTVTLAATNEIGTTVSDERTGVPSAPSVPSGPSEPSDPGEGETTTTPDGGVVTVETAEDGTVTTTVRWEDGREAQKVKTPEGDVSISVTSAEGEKVAEVTIPNVIPEGKEYQDVPENAWYEESVNVTSGLGLFSGTSETEFSPKAELTRAMIVTTLYRLSGEPVYGTDSTDFTDLGTGTWYQKAVNWACEAGIAEGIGEGMFAPKDNVKRQDMVCFIYRYVKAMGALSDESDSLERFADAEEVSSYAEEAFQWAVGAGILNGKENGILDPKGTATRAETATILTNLIEYLKK
jgi:hypothetical protein